MKRRRSILKIVAISAVFAVAFIPTLADAVREVLHGRGAAIYTNVYGLAIPYTSVLILVAAVVAVLAIAFIARLIYFWRCGHDSRAVISKIDAGAPSGKLGDSN
jgi:hypothetical protein